MKYEVDLVCDTEDGYGIYEMPIEKEGDIEEKYISFEELYEKEKSGEYVIEGYYAGVDEERYKEWKKNHLTICKAKY